MNVEEILITSVQYLSFIVFCLIFSFLLAWFERKIIARLQNRVGPPLLQPVYDFLKLSAKEGIYINKEGKYVLEYTPSIQLLLVFLLLFLLPIFGPTSILNFNGDLFLYITIFALSSATIFIIAIFSKSPYTLIGGNRSIITEISLEIPLILAFASLAIYTKSLDISSISAKFLPQITNLGSFKDIGFILLFFIIFLIIIISYLGVLELNPFSTPKAETEIVSGWKTELTGKNLAIVELSEHLKMFAISTFIASIFLGNSFYGFEYTTEISTYLLLLINIIFFSIKVFFIAFILMFVHVISARSRIHTIAESFWLLLLLSSVCVIGIVVLEVV